MRPIPGVGARICGGYRILQNGIQYDPEVHDRLGGSTLCTNLTVAKTYLIEQDYRNALFANSGPVTLLHLGSVSSQGSLPAYTGSVGTIPFTPQVGLWWNPTESGSRYSIDVKHGVMVATIFSYKQNGDPEWYLAAGPMSADGRSFTGTLDKYRNGQCIYCAYSGSPTLTGNDGTLSIQFSSPTAATMTLPGGRVIAIQPQAF